MRGHGGHRYPAVPWLETSDLKPMGEPETSVELPGDVTLGLRILHPFGVETDAILAVRAIVDDTPLGVITLAIGAVVVRATPPETGEVPVQSNPRRHSDPPGDGA